MYQDQILLLIGAISLVIFLLLMIYLAISRKKSKMYKKIIDKETEALASISATFSHTQSMAAISNPFESLAEQEPEEATIVNHEHIETLADTGTSSATISGTQVVGLTSLKPVTDFDPTILKGQYTLLGEIDGGGMSRVFLARKENTGNEWIVKYVPANIGELTNEADILKALNHINLPSIIDIFNDETGLYIVQSYIEGMGMNRVLRANDNIHEFVVMDWAQQLAQVLSYLHGKGPILHLDLKPSNIMVTNDNNLVLIDFGISRWQSDTSDSLGVTVSYAAPEQLKKKAHGKSLEIMTKRFGDTLPKERHNWQLDERTDIYSFGVIMFEAAVGHIPTHNTMHRLRDNLSKEASDIIYKCLALNPLDRYPNIDALLADIQKQRTHAKPAMLKNLIKRKAAKFSSAAAMVVAVTGFASGWFVMQQEVNAAMFVNPEIIMVSLHQSSEMIITRLLPNSNQERPINPSNLRWNFTADNIAQVDGNRIIGLNTGETLISGTYRNAAISMMVNVVEPMNGMVDISLRYNPGTHVNLFAGTTYRARVEGDINTMNFVSPQSVALAASGAMYIADAGFLRRFYNGFLETIELNPHFIRPQVVRAFGDDIYILTSPWQDDDDHFFGIIRITEYGGEGFFLGDARNTAIRDFYVYDNLIYIIQRNEGTGRTELITISTQNPQDVNTLTELPSTTNAIAIADNRIYLSDGEEGVLFVYENGTLTHLAGAMGENAFIDGTAPLFYRPTRIRYHNGNLYVWDFNVLRRLTMENGIAHSSVTIAGRASPVYELENFAETENAENIILPFSYLTDFAFLENEILLTDPKRGVIWSVN